MTHVYAITVLLSMKPPKLQSNCSSKHNNCTQMGFPSLPFYSILVSKIRKQTNKGTAQATNNRE